MTRKNGTTSADTRENLLKLAARSFGTQGYAATTMRGIAEQAGIEAASIYYHFGSKEEMVEAVMNHAAESFMQELAAHIDAVPKEANALVRFRAALVGVMNGLVKHGDFAVAHNRLLGQLPDKVRDRQVLRREEHHQVWNTLLEQLRTERFLRDDVDIALTRMFVLGSINSIHAWFDPRKGSLENIANQLCSIVFQGVAAPSARPRVARDLAAT